MKKILSAALALSLAGASLAATEASAAASGHSSYRGDTRHNDGRYDRGNGYGHAYDNHRHWQRGQRYHGGYAVDWRRSHLRQPPRGYHWVRSDNDFLLVALTTGLIIDVIAHSR